MESRLTQDPPLENIPYRGDGGITAKECCSVQFSGAQGRQEKISLRYSDDGLMLVFPLEGREASRQRGKDETRMHGKATCASVNKKETMEKKLVKKSVARSSAASKGKTDSETRVRSCLKPEVKSRIDKGKQSWKKLKPADIQTHTCSERSELHPAATQTGPNSPTQAQRRRVLPGPTTPESLKYSSSVSSPVDLMDDDEKHDSRARTVQFLSTGSPNDFNSLVLERDSLNQEVSLLRQRLKLSHEINDELQTANANLEAALCSLPPTSGISPPPSSSPQEATGITVTSPPRARGYLQDLRNLEKQLEEAHRRHQDLQKSMKEKLAQDERLNLELLQLHQEELDALRRRVEMREMQHAEEKDQLKSQLYKDIQPLAISKVLEVVLSSLDQHLQSSLLSFAGIDEEKLSQLMTSKEEDAPKAESKTTRTAEITKNLSSFSESVMAALDNMVNDPDDENALLFRARVMSLCRKVEDTLGNRMKDIQNAKETICRAYESAMVRMSDEMKSFQVEMTKRQNTKSESDRVSTEQLQAIKRKLLELQKQQERSEEDVRKEIREELEQTYQEREKELMKKIESRNERQISVLRSEHAVEVQQIQQKHDDEIQKLKKYMENEIWKFESKAQEASHKVNQNSSEFSRIVMLNEKLQKEVERLQESSRTNRAAEGKEIQALREELQRERLKFKQEISKMEEHHKREMQDAISAESSKFFYREHEMQRNHSQQMATLQGNLAVINAELEYLREKEETRRHALLSSAEKSREARAAAQQLDPRTLSNSDAAAGTSDRLSRQSPPQLDPSSSQPADSQLGMVLERYLTPSQLGRWESAGAPREEPRRSPLVQASTQSPASAQLDKYLKKNWS